MPIFLTGTLGKPSTKITEVQNSHQKSIRDISFGKYKLEQMKKIRLKFPEVLEKTTDPHQREKPVDNQ